MVITRIVTIRGRGSPRDRVHVFDRRSGCYLARGFVRDRTLYLCATLELAPYNIIVRRWGAARTASRVADPS
jgi:hypothetical protein